jgi:hypothetical protein
VFGCIAQSLVKQRRLAYARLATDEECSAPVRRVGDEVGQGRQLWLASYQRLGEWGTWSAYEGTLRAEATIAWTRSTHCELIIAVWRAAYRSSSECMKQAGPDGTASA